MAFILVILMQWLGLVHEIARLLVRQQKGEELLKQLADRFPKPEVELQVIRSPQPCSDLFPLLLLWLLSVSDAYPPRCASVERVAVFTGCAVHSLPACFCGMDSTGATSPWHLRQMAQAFTTTFSVQSRTLSEKRLQTRSLSASFPA